MYICKYFPELLYPICNVTSTELLEHHCPAFQDAAQSLHGIPTLDIEIVTSTSNFR